MHFFVTQALTEVALFATAETVDRATRHGDKIDPHRTFWEELFELRDLFKFEFFFADKEEFREEVAREIALHDPLWQRRMDEREGLRLILARVRPYLAPPVLRSLAEAYRVVAHALLLCPTGEELAEKRFLARCMGLARQYQLQRRLRSSESLSQVLFRSAWQLASNRGLTAPDASGSERRRFAAQWDDVVRCLDAIEAFSLARLAGETRPEYPIA